MKAARFTITGPEGTVEQLAVPGETVALSKAITRACNTDEAGKWEIHELPTTKAGFPELLYTVLRGPGHKADIRIVRA